jgi:FlaA1/EpsC-like NDP-sugar epimerase
VVFTSSDKAVNPTNVMGTSKLMGERLMTAANGLQQSGGCMFLSTRFGNVLGSNGSVIPLFHQQIRNGGPITLTHPDMTRFIMSIEEAVRLVIDSAGMACGGEVFVTKMPVARIEDLAVVMRDEIAPMYGFRPDDIPIEVTGPRPGEKMFEELMSEEETRRAIELERYFSVLPTFRGWKSDVAYEYEGTISTTVDNPYSSRVEPSLSRDDLHAFLIHNQLLGFTQQETPPSQPADMLPEVKTVTASEQLVS